MYYRYELMIDDEYQEVGFLHGIGELPMNEDEEEALLKDFNDNLPVPVFFEKQRVEAYFTETGKMRFSVSIERVITAFEQSGLFNVRTKELQNLDTKRILYRDEYQVLIAI